MTVEVVDPVHPEAEIIQRAAALLRAGRLVAFPTETVYGLGANALDDDAVRRIFETKGRPAYNPLIVHVASAESAWELAAEWSAAAEALSTRFWPGPLTLVLPKRALVPDLVTAGLPTVALRVPMHPVALALLREARLPIAAPSANRFTRISPTTAEHVRLGLQTGIDLILDAGPTRVGIESTVVDLTRGQPVLLRPGTIPTTALEDLVGPLAHPGDPGRDDAPRASPGMLRQHYSPRARLQLFPAGERDAMVRTAREAAAAGQEVGGLLLRPLAPILAHSIAMPPDADDYAARLYAALHELDDAGCALIVVDEVPESPAWAGVRDRLARAAHSA